ncbi:YvrJ family protein [Clostridium chromiireducens]|uniref:YvrJ family protein n=1 Tax=Clostridium chromiireducens TaxID=225345 RepID=A0A399IPZ5_9CLOT|nr:YvrJ family protein [Clostridium chromiireducens]RII35020.1 YvrJ family protein [Clostridium chromiireducens]
MGINDVMSLITNAGFPIAVCAYLLFRLEKQLSNPSSSIHKLNTIISTKLGVVINTSSDKINNV